MQRGVRTAEARVQAVALCRGVPRFVGARSRQCSEATVTLRRVTNAGPDDPNATGNAANGASTPDADADAARRRRRRRAIIGGLGALAVVLVIVVAVLLVTRDEGSETASSASATTTTTAASSTTTSGASSTTTASSATTTSNATTTSTATNAPTVTLTANPTSIACPAANVSTTLPPTTVALTWTSTNATGVDLSVDGGGLYNSYGPNGNATLNVPCDGNTHTYTATAKGTNGQTAKQTVSVATHK